MEQDKKHDIALMRYSAIAPIIPGLPDDYVSLNEFFRSVSERGILHPCGELRHYAPATLQKWYWSYQNGGFDALLPTGRSDAGHPRKIDDDLKAQIQYIKDHYPRMGASAIYRQLQDNGSIRQGDVSEATINRFINQLDLQNRNTTNEDMRRYERPHINEVWCGDTSSGPYLQTEDGKKHRVYIIALIDDASRFITGIDIFFNDNFINLMSVMKAAVSKYGVPKVCNFDNGGSFKNKQMELLAARIGTVLNYCRPYTPTAKAKIERWFRTLKDTWMSTLDMRNFKNLDELRGSLLEFVRKYNQSIHSSLKGLSPQDRFFSEPECIRRLPESAIENAFLLEIERRVSADCVIVIDHVEYEVHHRFAKQRIRLRYSPDMADIYIVEHDGTLSPVRLLNKQENANVKREKIRLSGGDT